MGPCICKPAPLAGKDASSGQEAAQQKQPSRRGWSLPFRLGRKSVSPKEQYEQLRTRLQRVATQIAPTASYDYSKSTQENYAAVSSQATNIGPYAAIRDSLDASYHGAYTPARQRLQDELIAGTLAAGASQPTPWLIYTAGPMGAGKSQCVSWRSNSDPCKPRGATEEE